MPTDSRPLEPIGTLTRDQDDELERVSEREGAEFARSDFGLEETALLDCAGEASMCRALGCHRRRGPAGGPYLGWCIDEDERQLEQR